MGLVKILKRILKITIITISSLAVLFIILESIDKNPLNIYISENEISGICSDYAIDFSVRTGAYLVINSDRNIGVYQLKELSDELVSRHSIDDLNPNKNNNVYGFVKDDIDYLYVKSDKKWYITKLIETYPVDVSYFSQVHAWNQIENFWIDVTLLDTNNMNLKPNDFIWEKGTKLTVREEKP